MKAAQATPALKRDRGGGISLQSGILDSKKTSQSLANDFYELVKLIMSQALSLKQFDQTRDRKQQKHYERFIKALENMPPSGGGGCHGALLGAANHGVNADIDPQQIHNDLRGHIRGSRRVTDREIKTAIEKASADKGNIVHYSFKKKKQKPIFDSKKALKKIISLGEEITEADIWDASPIRIDWEPQDDPIRLLDHLYQTTDSLFLGEPCSSGIIDKTIRTASEWKQYFTKGGQTFPHIIPNPLSGKHGLTQDGKPTFRGDACVKDFRFAIVEFDDLSKAEQLAFWFGVNLPVVALIDSGNKSIHGWVRIDGIVTSDEWTQQVEVELFRDILIPLGVDGVCRNEARLSRLPGHQRDNGKMQKLLYLAPKGRRVKG